MRDKEEDEEERFPSIPSFLMPVSQKIPSPSSLQTRPNCSVHGTYDDLEKNS